MAAPFNRWDLERGNWKDDYVAISDGRIFPAEVSGRIYIGTSFGRKWTSQVAYDGYTARYPLNETAGTTATDAIGAKNGTYTGGFTLNQAGTIAEAGTHSILLNGTTGYVDLGANGVDLTSGSWGFVVLFKPSALGASHRGLFGGPPGAYCASLLNGDIHVGVVGGGDIQLPNFSRSVGLNVWNIVGITYDAGSNQLRRFLFWDGLSPQDQWYEVTNTLVPTPGVKSNQIGRRDTGGYFQGNMQEALFIKPGVVTEAMVGSLWEPDARTRTADKSGALVVNADATTNPVKAISKMRTNPNLPGKPNDRCERVDTFDLAQYINQTRYWSFAFFFPSDSNWATAFTSPSQALGIGQILGRNMNAASVLMNVWPVGYQGITGPAFAPLCWGGLYRQSDGALEDRVTLDPNLGNGWNVLAPRGTYDTSQRFPQVIGPNTMLGGVTHTIGSHPITLDVWHELIMRFTASTDQFTGAIEWWHREKGSGGNFVKTVEVGTGANGGQPRKTVQWNSAVGQPPAAAGVNNNIAFGSYAHINSSLEVYHGSIAEWSTFADAQAAFPSEGAPTLIQIEQRAFRGRNDDGTEATATWKAAANTNWTQFPNENFRVRFEAQETAGVAGASGAVQLQYNRNGSGWNNVTDVSSVVRAFGSPFLTDAGTTTNQLTAGTGTFAAGLIDELNGVAGSVTLPASGNTEWEFCAQIVGADVLNADTIQLRLTYVNDSAPLYTAVPALTVSAASTQITDTYGLQVLATSGLVGYWRLGDTTGVLADALEVLNGSYIGGITQSQAGIPGSEGDAAALFNGTTGYAEVPDNNLLDRGNGPFTLIAWIKRTATGSKDGILSKGSGAFCFYLAADNTLRLQLNNSTDVATSTGTLTDTSGYHMVAVTYNGGTTGLLYIDGVAVAETTSTAVMASNALPLKIGAIGS